MAIIAKEENRSESIAAGMYQAVCAMVCDIGTHKGEYQGVPNKKHQVVIIWELNETRADGKLAGERFHVSKFYTLSLDEKANLRKDLQSWRGKTFNEEELKGFDLEKLIGVNCFLNIIVQDGKSKIAAISPMTKGIEKISPILKIEPEWVSKMRAKSIEFAEVMGSTEEDVVNF